jgi:hypothetical protein
MPSSCCSCQHIENKFHCFGKVIIVFEKDGSVNAPAVVVFPTPGAPWSKIIKPFPVDLLERPSALTSQHFIFYSPFPLIKSAGSSFSDNVFLERKCCVTNERTIRAWPSGSSSLSKAAMEDARASAFSYRRWPRSSIAIMFRQLASLKDRFRKGQLLTPFATAKDKPKNTICHDYELIISWHPGVIVHLFQGLWGKDEWCS